MCGSEEGNKTVLSSYFTSCLFCLFSSTPSGILFTKKLLTSYPAICPLTSEGWKGETPSVGK